MRRAAALFLLCSMLAACGEGEAGRSRALRLATTTSTENSGLLDHLLPTFTAQTGLQVEVLSVGTGQALKLGARGDADVVLVHDRAREEAFVKAGHAPARRDVMWNDFVILGPAHDPAGIRGRAPAQALARIWKARARFVSRGDDSGTHARERALWRQAAIDPTGADPYIEAGQGMGPCLVIADERRAYVLADRGTYLAFSDRVELAVLVEGHPALRNPYGIMVVGDGRRNGADRLVAYLTSPEGQDRIGSFQVKGQVLFHPHAGDD